MKKRWIVVPVMVGILALGALTAGAVFAQDNSTTDDSQSPISRFTSRVAEILGLDQAQVEDAFQQAQREMQDEALQNKLDQMVTNGVLTQEQADSYLQWYQSRPEGVPGLLGGPGFGRGHGFGHRGFNGFGGDMRGFGYFYQAPATPNNSAEATPGATAQ